MDVPSRLTKSTEYPSIGCRSPAGNLLKTDLRRPGEGTGMLGPSLRGLSRDDRLDTWDLVCSLL